MKIIVVFSTIVFFLLGCESKPVTQKTPKEAFARLAPCVNSGDYKCLYGELDRDSRWSIQSINRILIETSTLVKNSYPDDKNIRTSAFGKWEEEAQSKTPKEMFEVFCKKRHCLKKIASGFGAIVQLENIGEMLVKIKTTKNVTFSLSKADELWGLSIFKDELQREKIRLADNLNQIRINAKEYEEHRLATEN